MSQSMYVVMHGGLKLDKELAAELKLDPKTSIAPIGAVLELDDDFVKQVDPAGVQFVTEAQYETLLAKVEANDAAEASIAKLRETVETQAQKLASERVSRKLLIAVRAIEAAKRAPKSAKGKAKPAPIAEELEPEEPADEPEETDEAPEPKPTKPSRAPKSAKGK